MTITEEITSPERVGQSLGVCAGTVRAWIRDGKGEGCWWRLPSGHYRIRKASFIAAVCPDRQTRKTANLQHPATSE